LSYNFLLNLLLSLSALHLACQQPERRDFLRRVAEKHANASLRGNTIALASLTPENGQAVYMSAILARHIRLARGPSSEDCLLFRGSDHGPADWFILFPGIRSLHQPFGSSVGFDVYWNAFGQNQDTEVRSPPAKPPSFSPSGWAAALKALQNQISSNSGDKPVDILCQMAMDSLARTYIDTFVKTNPTDTTGLLRSDFDTH
jgi:hypothetical protein